MRPGSAGAEGSGRVEMEMEVEMIGVVLCWWREREKGKGMRNEGMRNEGTREEGRRDWGPFGRKAGGQVRFLFLGSREGARAVVLHAPCLAGASRVHATAASLHVQHGRSTWSPGGR
jgi:hypothetical protein